MIFLNVKETYTIFQCYLKEKKKKLFTEKWSILIYGNSYS